VLRAEMTINNPARINVLRRSQNDPKWHPMWRPIRQGVVDLPHRAEVGQQANERYLQALGGLAQTHTVKELAEPLTMGIGIHTGDAIIGQMGPPKMPILTALGDAVNTAARLENATKELQVPVVISRDTLEAAQLSAEPTLRDVLLRGRSTQLSVAALDKNSLRQLLGATAHL